MEGPSALIFGHSFVKHYKSWISSHHHAAPASQAHVCNRISDLQMLGISGLKSDQLHEHDYLFQASRYDIVIIDCGTNDLSRGKTYVEVAHNILVFARHCIEEGSKLAIVTSILPRTTNMHCSEDEFYNQMELYNNYMKQLCIPEDKISFHTHKGFRRQFNDTIDQPIANWSLDGIHPHHLRRFSHQKSGMEKYHESMKTALHRATHRLAVTYSGYLFPTNSFCNS